MKALAIYLILIIFSSSCSSTIVGNKHDSHLAKKNNYGVFKGKLKVTYDNLEKTQDCFLSFTHETDGEFETIVPISENGSFIGSAPKGKVILSSVMCNHSSGHDDYSFNDEGMSFTNKGKKQTFIGNLEVVWEPSKMNPLVTVIGALVGWIAVSSSGESFMIKNHSEVSRKIASNHSNISLVKVPKRYWSVRTL